jgi:hypothetical protein
MTQKAAGYIRISKPTRLSAKKGVHIILDPELSREMFQPLSAIDLELTRSDTTNKKRTKAVLFEVIRKQHRTTRGAAAEEVSWGMGEGDSSSSSGLYIDFYVISHI